MCHPEPGREGKGPGSPEPSLPVIFLATQQQPLLKTERKVIILIFRFFSEDKEKAIVNSYWAFGEKKLKENSTVLLNFSPLFMTTESINTCYQELSKQLLLFGQINLLLFKTLNDIY